MRTATHVLRLYVVATLLGASVGIFSVLFLGAIEVLDQLVWRRLPDAVPWLDRHQAVHAVGACTLGGLFVGVVNRGTASGLHEDEGVHDLDHALADSFGPPPRPAGLLRLAALGVLSLGFGASLGPEAPLVLVVAGLAGRLQGVLHLAREETVQLSVSGALGGLLGAPLGAVALPVEGSEPVDLRARVARLGPSAVAAVAGLWILLALLPNGSLHAFTVPDVLLESRRLDLVWWALAGLLAAFAGAALHAALPPLQRLVARVVRPLVPRAVAGGLVLGLCGAVTPLALRSGHHETQALLDGVGERGALALLGIAAVRSVALLACLSSGWFGGEIFPAAMVGVTVGLVVADLAGTHAVAACAAAGLVAASATMMQRPVAALLVMVFFLPAGTLVPAAVGAALAAGVLAWLRPAATGGPRSAA